MHARKIAIVTVSISLAFSLSACGAGTNAPTAMINQVTDGVDGSITTYGNNLDVRSVLLVSQADGSANLVGTIVNKNSTQDTLIGITINGINATLSQPTIALTQNSAIRFAGETANASAIIPGLNATVGTRVKVQLSFASAGELTLDAIVRDRSGAYANVGA